MSAPRSPLPTGNDHEYVEDDAACARVTENIGLLRRFLGEVFANPALAEEVPDGATLVLFDAAAETPDRAKADAADAMERAGRTVYRRAV